MEEVSEFKQSSHFSESELSNEKWWKNKACNKFFKKLGKAIVFSEAQVQFMQRI